MKKSILVSIVAIATILFTSCEKEEGYMYHATHFVHFNDRNGVEVHRQGGDFFEYPVQDDQAAFDWYKNSDNYQKYYAAEDDSLHVVYYCTVEEWNDK